MKQQKVQKVHKTVADYIENSKINKVVDLYQFNTGLFRNLDHFFSNM